MGATRTFSAMAVVAAFLLFCSTSASATVYNVNSSDYTKTATLLSTSIMDNFEMTVKSGDHIKYSVSVNTQGGCAQLFFSKGHNIGLQSQYLVAYSQENCVQSYSNEYPADGTEFTVSVATSYANDLNYTVSIKTFTPAIPDWLVGVLVLVIIFVVVAVIGAVIRGRRRRKAAEAQQMVQQWQPPEQQPPIPPQ